MEQIKHILRDRFARDESGAITVDWVVLTAALIAIGMGAAFYVNASVPVVADSVSDYMTSVDVNPYD